MAWELFLELGFDHPLQGCRVCWTIYRPLRKQSAREHRGAIAAIDATICAHVENTFHGVIIEPATGICRHVMVKTIVPLDKSLTPSLDRVCLPASCRTSLVRKEII